MNSRICDMLGMAVPVFAFSHCRDVVVAASKAGAMGVLGADTFTPEQLDIELQWIARHIGDRPFGVNVLFPSKFEEVEGRADVDLETLLPRRHRQFIDDLLARHLVPKLPDGEEEALIRERLRHATSTPASSNRLLEVAFKYPGVKLMVSAIGTPPREIIERAHAAGIRIGAQAGKPEHAIRHRDAGVDFVIAQGYEAGGHTGEIASMVLTPQVVDAVAPLPVLAAGGIASGRQVAAALALGAEGVWCGSVWLTTVESETSPDIKAKFLAAASADTVRSKSFTGKPCRILKSAWSDAWESPDAPPALMRPIQHLLRIPAFARIERARSQALLTYPVGQVVGQMNAELTVRQVLFDLLSELNDSVERLNLMLERE